MSLARAGLLYRFNHHVQICANPEQSDNSGQTIALFLSMVAGCVILAIGMLRLPEDTLLMIARTG